MSNFKNHDQYEEYKEDNNQCYVKGCDCDQNASYLCENHEDDEENFFRECEQCHIPVPVIARYCEFHGGVSYTDDMKQRMLDSIKPVDNSFAAKLGRETKRAMSNAALAAFVNTTKTAIVNLLKDHTDSELMGKINKFIDSELGRAVYTLILSTGVSFLPGDSLHIDTEALSSQLREHALAHLGESVFTLLVPALGTVLKDLTAIGAITNTSRQLENISVVKAPSVVVKQEVVETVGVGR